MGVAELGPSGFVAPVPYNWLVAIAVPPAHRPLTEEDLARLPDDGLRYELIDGELLVSPAPAPLHQRVSMNLSLLLSRACPPGYEVLAAPTDAPSLTVFRLDNGRFRDLSVATDDEPYRATDPFPVEVVPSDLVRPASPS